MRPSCVCCVSVTDTYRNIMLPGAPVSWPCCAARRAVGAHACGKVSPDVLLLRNAWEPVAAGPCVESVGTSTSAHFARSSPRSVPACSLTRCDHPARQNDCRCREQRAQAGAVDVGVSAWEGRAAVGAVAGGRSLRFPQGPGAGSHRHSRVARIRAHAGSAGAVPFSSGAGRWRRWPHRRRPHPPLPNLLPPPCSAPTHRPQAVRHLCAPRWLRPVLLCALLRVSGLMAGRNVRWRRTWVCKPHT